MFPALAGGFLSTVPPGKSLGLWFLEMQYVGVNVALATLLPWHYITAMALVIS